MSLFDSADLLRVVQWLPIPVFLLTSEGIRLATLIRHRPRSLQVLWSVAAIALGTALIHSSSDSFGVLLPTVIPALVHLIRDAPLQAVMSVYGFALGILFGLHYRRSIKDSETETWPRVSRYFRIYVAAWMLTYIVYPSWLWTHPIPYEPFRSMGRFEQYQVIQFILLAFFTLTSIITYRYMAETRPTLRRDCSATQGRLRFADRAPFLALAVVYIALQIPNMLTAVQVGGDEVFHLVGPLKVMQLPIRAADLGYASDHIPISTIFSALRAVLLASLLVIVGVTIGFRKSASFRRFFERARTSTVTQSSLVLVGLCVVSSSYVFFTHFSADGFVFRFAPLSKVFGALVYLGFGIHEFPMRLLQVLFTVGAAYLLSEMVSWFFDRWAAFAAATVFLFACLNYSYLYLAYIDAGALFFMVLPVYFFVKYWRDEERKDLLLSFLVCGIGVTYKRPSAVAFFVICAGLAGKEWFRLRIDRKKLANAFYPGLAGVSLIVPWFVISRHLIDDNYRFTPANYWLLERWLAYPKLYWGFLPALVSVFALIGLGLALRKGRTPLERTLLLWLGIFALFLVGMQPRYVPYFRISNLMLPVIAVYSAVGFWQVARYATARLKMAEKATSFLVGGFVVYCMIALAPKSAWQYPLIPEPRDVYSDAAVYLKKNVPAGYPIYSDFEAIGFTATSEFHRLKYGLDPFVTRRPAARWLAAESIGEQYFDELYEFLQDHDVLYALFAKFDAWEDSRDPESRFLYRVGGALEKLRDPRFERIATFSNDQRSLHLVRVRSEDESEILNAIEAAEWREVPDRVLVGLRQRTITPAVAGDILRRAREHVSEQGMESLLQAWQAHDQQRIGDSALHLKEAARLGLEVRRSSQIIWRTSDVTLREIPPDSAAALIDSSKPKRVGSLELYRVVLLQQARVPDTGSLWMFDADLARSGKAAEELVLLTGGVPVARHILPDSPASSGSSLVNVEFPFVVPESVGSGQMIVELAVLEAGSGECPQPGRIGTLSIDERLDAADGILLPDAALTSSPTLLRNGGFEQGWQGWRVRSDLWRPFGVVASLDASTAHTGARSLRIEFTGATDPNYYDVTQVVDALEPDTQYRLTFYTKAEGLASRRFPVIQVRALPGGQLLYSQPARGTTGWTYQEIHVNIVGAQQQMEIRVIRHGDDRQKWCLANAETGLIRGTVWFDDFEITPLDSPALSGNDAGHR